ncbi:MAG: type I glutamate--ammonia ligase [Bacteroidota bacterium]|nr:type I glutamate--ammonia ligase [Bacteroidota bacterium]MDP4234412.1 type I glutamate--ammonia ligase [Bacteroidota bacterium]MDP4243344.1 type I glutamate--ammonia ligase [Bacteroidota bacterium]
MTKSEVLSHAKDQKVEFINVMFTDLLGVMKALTIPVSKLEDAIESNVWFDGSSVEGFARIAESDMYLKLDLKTFTVIPWSRASRAVTALIIADVYMPDGTPFEGDPRGILKRQLKRAADMGYTFNTGPELEFFLFKKNGDSLQPLPHDTAGYFDQTTDIASEIRKEMSFALFEMGIDVEALHHEVAIGQHEIDFKYDNALRCADIVIIMKYALKSIAMHHDLHCTFMPKPIAGINGSGMHVHQSLFSPDGKKNLMYDPNGEYLLSSLAKSYIAGQLVHIKAMNAILNPTVNSYKRLVVGYEAPVYVAWGQRNRSALIRIPRITKGREKAVRAELRCPDPSANPYLAFAVMLAAGLDGIEKKMQAPAPVEENIFEFTDETAAARGITTVAKNLMDAIEELKKDPVICEALGSYCVEKLVEAKTAEWDSFRMSVTQWELDRYLEVY